MFLKEKFDALGNFVKNKARLVAGGDGQDRLLYENLSSPTLSTTSIFMLAGIAALEERKVVTIDITGAYLNARMKETVYMQLNELLSKTAVELDPAWRRFMENGTLTVRLDMALYGCVEAALLWYTRFKDFMLSIGFSMNPYDLCVFNLSKNGVQITTGVYVDDIFVTSVSDELIDWFEEQLRKEFKEITVNRGAVHSYLGMVFDFRTPGAAKVSMEGYTNDVLKLYDVKGTAVTPASEQLFVVREDAEKLSPEEAKVFHSKVAKLLYLAKRTRPDLLLGIAFLATRVKSPDVDDAQKLDRILRYTKGTRELYLTLRFNKNMQIDGSIDVSHATHVDKKSHTGSVTYIGKDAGSTKQKLVTTSSCEAELVGIPEPLRKLLWTQKLLQAQGYTVPPIRLQQDNMSTITLINKGRSNSGRTRHIDIRYFFVKDRIDSGEVVT